MPGTVTRRLPAGDRPGVKGLLGPVCLVLSLLGWLLPYGEVASALAVTTGAISILTDRQYRLDGLVIAGVCIAALQLFFGLLLFTMDLAGH